MLDSIFRNSGERKLADTELRDLLAEIREERAAVREERETARAEREALAAQMGRSAGAVSKLARTNKALDELSSRSDAAMRKLEALAGAVASHEERERSAAKLEQRMTDLWSRVEAAERGAQALNEPSGPMHAHRKALDVLGTEVRDARANLAALRQESDQFAEAQSQMRKASEALQHPQKGILALKLDFESLRKTEADLRQDVLRAREVAREAQADSQKAVEGTKEVATRFESLAQLQDVYKDGEKRVASLHALVEHVSLKAKALEAQRHSVDHAVAETARLDEMVWAMEAQVAKFAESRDKMQSAEDSVARIEKLARAASQDLAAATEAREAFVRETARVEGQGRALLDSLRAAAERLAVDKEEFGAFDERLKSLSASLADSEVRMQGVLAKNESLAAMQHKADGLAKVFADLRIETQDLAEKQNALEELTERLSVAEAQGKRTAAQHESLIQAQGDLDAMRAEVAELQESYGEMTRLRNKVSQDRSAFENFAERASAMIGRTPEIEGRLGAMLGKMSLLEQGNDSIKRLEAVTAGLDAELTRVSGRMQFVEKVEERLNNLFALTKDVERRMAEQVGRRAEIDSLAQQCNSLGTQIAYVQQHLEGVSSQQGRLQPLAAEVTRLGEVLEVSQRAMLAMKKGEAAAHEQQSRLAGLIEHGMRQAAETTDRLRQVQALGQDLAQVAARNEEVMGQLTQVQVRQREVLAHVSLTEEQMQRAEAMSRQLEQRRALMLSTEKTLTNFESRLADLDRHAGGLELKAKALADREGLIQSVKAEVDGIRQISSRSRADLQFVTDHRHDVIDLRGKVEDLLGRVGDTDNKFVQIESWRMKVDQAESSAQAITAMFNEMQGTLENLSEQRVVIDDVGEKLARLDFSLQEAQNTLGKLDSSAQEAQNVVRTLQREREVAERVEKSIKAVRARGNSPTA